MSVDALAISLHEKCNREKENRIIRLVWIDITQIIDLHLSVLHSILLTLAYLGQIHLECPFLFHNQAVETPS